MAKSTKEKIVKSAALPREDKVKKIKIKVIGLGGGGGNIVSEIASRISKASFAAANTDSKSLKSCSKKVVKFQFGENLTQGLGTGMDPELAKEAARSEKEKIKKLCQDQDLCILVACLGGGTGSGAITTFAKISKELGNLTYGIFTLPFKFEGEKKIEIAINALKEVKSNLNALTIIPNERVFHIINKDTPLKEALSTINQFLSESLGGLIETIYQPGLINIDFADFKTVFEGKGRLAYLNAVELQRKEDAIKDIETKVLNSPLYPYTTRGAKGVLLNIVGEKNLPLFDVEQISKTISKLVSPEAKIIFGISQQNKRSNAIRTVLLAVGCGTKIFSPPSNEKKPKKKKKLKPTEEKVEAEKKQLPKRKKKAFKNKKPNRPSKKNKDRTEEKSVPAENSPSKKEILEAAEGGGKIRKNGLQIKKEVEEAEKEILEKEKFWEKPAFLRKK